jgi:ketosteroid isomerase-like protein
MRSIFLLGAPLALFACATPIPAPSDARLEAEIVAAERARLKAFRDNDRAAFANMVTEDLAMVHSDGSVLDKAGEMAVMRSSTSDRPLPTLDIEDVRVRASGEVGVITGSLVERRQGRLLLRLRFTNVYTRRAGRWKLASGQLTRASTTN